MSHASRHFPGGMVYHVLNRGVSRRTLFEKHQDFLAFERVVEEALRTCRMRICASCLLSNPWHWVLWPERDGDLAAFMRQMTNMHVKRWKEYRHEVGYGHLYQGRYKCFPVETENYFYQVVRYVESATPCVRTWRHARRHGCGRACAEGSARIPRFQSSPRGRCHAPPTGWKSSTARKARPNWRVFVAACSVARLWGAPSGPQRPQSN